MLGSKDPPLIWMAVEIAMVGYSKSPPLQPFYLLLGAVVTGVGWVWRIRRVARIRVSN